MSALPSRWALRKQYQHAARDSVRLAYKQYELENISLKAHIRVLEERIRSYEVVLQSGLPTGGAEVNGRCSPTDDAEVNALPTRDVLQSGCPPDGLESHKLQGKVTLQSGLPTGGAGASDRCLPTGDAEVDALDVLQLGLTQMMQDLPARMDEQLAPCLLGIKKLQSNTDQFNKHVEKSCSHLSNSVSLLQDRISALEKNRAGKKQVSFAPIEG